MNETAREKRLGEITKLLFTQKEECEGHISVLLDIIKISLPVLVVEGNQKSANELRAELEHLRCWHAKTLLWIEWLGKIDVFTPLPDISYMYITHTLLQMDKNICDGILKIEIHPPSDKSFPTVSLTITLGYPSDNPLANKTILRQNEVSKVEFDISKLSVNQSQRLVNRKISITGYLNRSFLKGGKKQCAAGVRCPKFSELLSEVLVRS
eukprot:GHVL01041857.1.p1 GENE.GHVL01041857.1~~GHVL01041857.1.p1  ORF type:complete len:210 (+),score=35.81 GHVL01041857.1:538-1167(+)